MKNVFNIVGLLFIGLMVTVSSCKEEVAPTILEVQVVTDSGDIVPFANILLTCTSSVNLPCDIEIISNADENGKYTREFDLPKVLQVTVQDTILDTTYTSFGAPIITETPVLGQSFVSIKPEETSRATIIVYRQ